MPTFIFQARNPRGRPQTGTQEAASAAALVNDLRQRGWLVLKVEEAAPAFSLAATLAGLNPFAWLPPSSLDIEVSLQQLSIMLRSGLTLLTALRAVAEYARKRSMRRVWNEVADRIQQGSGLADALTGYRCFPFLVVQLVKVGEQTGTLEQVMLRAAEALERRRLLRTHLLTALTYPTIVLLAAIGVTVFMIVGVIPKLQTFLRALGRQLPAMTQALLDVSSFVQTSWLWVLGTLFLLIIALVMLYLWPPGRLFIDRLLLRLPIVGRLLRLAATAQFAHGLFVLLRSGITLVEGLRTVEHLHRNRWVSGKVTAARTAVIQGSSLAEPLDKAGAFMPMLPKMVAVGEAAGTLDEVLEEVSRFHESQLQSSIKRLSALIEPAIVVVVGGIVGFVYISFFVALFSAAGGAR